MNSAPQSDCIFCKIASGAIPAPRLYEDDDVLAFADLNPQAPTHVLVIPKQHLKSLAETEAGHSELLGKLLHAATAVARRQGLDKGYRVVINTGEDGGQTVSHLHLHVLGGRAMHWPPG
jgi:histidine triad (HIT) family protein